MRGIEGSVDREGIRERWRGERCAVPAGDWHRHKSNYNPVKKPSKQTSQVVVEAEAEAKAASE